VDDNGRKQVELLAPLLSVGGRDLLAIQSHGVALLQARERVAECERLYVWEPAFKLCARQLFVALFLGAQELDDDLLLGPAITLLGRT
jgi:hypothetical protein